MDIKEKAITSDEMYKIEERGHYQIGISRSHMMENAGHGIADFVVSRYKHKLQSKTIVVVCGTGNNGGDGFVASRHLADFYGAKLTTILLGHPNELRSEEAKMNWHIIKKMTSIEIIFRDKLNSQIKARIHRANIIIDGIFGTGVKGTIREPYASAIEHINRSDAYKVSIDLPSGLDPNTGNVSENCIEADATITFHRMKIGLLNNKKYTGSVFIERIGIPKIAEKGIII
jgi:NAD(P)H-hydrate epimerase